MILCGGLVRYLEDDILVRLAISIDSDPMNARVSSANGVCDSELLNFLKIRKIALNALAQPLQQLVQRRSFRRLNKQTSSLLILWINRACARWAT